MIAKYRLRIGDEIVGYEKWYVGDGSDSKWLYCKNPAGQYPDNVWRPDYIYHTDKDQFTGLCDKNRVEIYGGDLIKLHPDTGKGEIQEVYWADSDCLWWMIGDKEKREGIVACKSRQKDYEIVGNGFQDKDLLEKQ